MCGICGTISTTRLDESDIQRITAMNHALAHRGPDDSSQYLDDHTMLAMRRLSIIDIAGGRQPLTNEDGSIVLVANGEIYNYIELQQELLAQGHRLRTNSDCETIVHLYEEFGPACLNRLRGMFAFALWDRNRQQLMIARDRIGEKPLHFYQSDRQLIFASEIQALARHLPEACKLDVDSVDKFMHFQCIPEPVTLVKQIRKLSAGHYMLVRLNPWSVETIQYWNIESIPALDCADPPKRIAEELEEISRLIIRSDVPVGISLSGGLDSNAIAALASAKMKDRLHAFTVGYEGRPDFDERHRAKYLADRLHLPFHEIEIKHDEYVAALPELVLQCNDAIGDISAFGYYAVMREARKCNVPVILSGFGGDELFWGYPWVVNSLQKNREKLHRLGGGLDACQRVARELTFYDTHYNFRECERLMPSLYTRSFKDRLTPSASEAVYRIDEPYNSLPLRICKALYDTWLLPNCICLGDRLSMAASIEMRLPLVDYKLTELVMGMHRHDRNSHQLGHKAWMKQAVAHLLPEDVLNYPKRGFQPPVHEWTARAWQRYGHLLAEGILVENRILSPDGVGKLLTESCDSKRMQFLYKLMFLEMWCRATFASQSSEEMNIQKKKFHKIPAGRSFHCDAAMKKGNTMSTQNTRASVQEIGVHAQRKLAPQPAPVGSLQAEAVVANPPLAVQQSRAGFETQSIGLFDPEPPEVLQARQMLKQYTQKRLRNIWYGPGAPVWYDHELDYQMWPQNLFWVERGVFGRVMMKPGCHVLDLCCGDGYYSDIWYSTIAGHIDACDNDKSALEFASQKHRNPKITYHNIDVVHGSLPGLHYDVVAWFEAIEHFSEQNILRVLQKIHAALSPGGVLVGSTSLVDQPTGAGNSQHDREFTSEQDLQSVIEPVFPEVQTWTSIYPNRTACYFKAVK